MDVAIRKVGRRDDKDRFVLIDVRTRKIITQRDASADSLRRFFRQRGISKETIETCLRLAIEQYAASRKPERPPVDEAAATIEDDNLLFELGLEGGDDPND